MKQTGIAFLVGGSISAFLFVAMRFGVDLGFRAAAYVGRRREARPETRTA